MYYLETNAVKAIGKKLQDISLSDSFTSYLALYEIIKNCAVDSKYHLNATSIRNIVDSGLNIRTEIPDEIVLNSFQLELVLDYGQYSIYDVVNAIYVSNSYNEFIFLVENNTMLKEEFAKITNYCLTLSKKFMEIHKDAFEHYFKKADAEIKDVIKVNSNKDLINRISKDLLNDLIDGLKSIFDIEETSKVGLRSLYDNKLDNYLKGYACYLIYNSRMGSSNADKNSWADLNHLIYVHNDISIVSDDKIYNKIIKSIFPELNLISVEDYIKAHTREFSMGVEK